MVTSKDRIDKKELMLVFPVTDNLNIQWVIDSYGILLLRAGGGFLENNIVTGDNKYHVDR